jgi:hypothetical protein
MRIVDDVRISYSFHAARGGNGDLLSHSKNRVAPTHPDGKRGSVESGRTWRLKSTWMENADFVEVERHPLYTRVREIFLKRGRELAVTVWDSRAAF